MSNSSIAAKLREFNNLPRPRTTPSGLPNHWVFRVRHVPLNPLGDLVVAVHPQSFFQLQAGQHRYCHCQRVQKGRKHSYLIFSKLSLPAVILTLPRGRHGAGPQMTRKWPLLSKRSEAQRAEHSARALYSARLQCSRERGHRRSMVIARWYIDEVHGSRCKDQKGQHRISSAGPTG